MHIRAKEKYRGVFEIQKSGDKTSSGEIGLDNLRHKDTKTLPHKTLRHYRIKIYRNFIKIHKNDYIKI